MRCSNIGYHRFKKQKFGRRYHKKKGMRMVFDSTLSDVTAKQHGSGFIQDVRQLFLIQFLDHWWVMHFDLGWESEDGSALVDARSS